MEFINPATGLRLDGRKVNEIRRIQCKIGVLSRADGSAFYQQGNTRVIAAVYGPREVTQKSKVLHDRAIINCEFSMAPFSTGERRKKTKGDRFKNIFLYSLCFQLIFLLFGKTLN